MNDSAIIEKMTGLQPSVCSCDKCKNLCRIAPCLPTPDDVIKLVLAGYASRLLPTTWAAGVPFGLPEIELVAPQYDNKRGCCTFLTDDGLCELHDKGLKPTEGRLAHHSVRVVDLQSRPPIAFAVASLWVNITGLRILK